MKDDNDPLGVKIDYWSMKETVDVIQDRIRRRIFTQHVVINVAKFISLQKDKKLRESIEACDIINADGAGIVWGSRLLGKGVPERVAGIDLFFNLLAMSQRNGYSVFLLGATQDVLSETCKKLQNDYPCLKIAGHHHGYFWESPYDVVKLIRGSNANLLFVAISSPLKESFINEWKDELGVNFVMGVGGTFDVIAGKVRRAPLWMQVSGLEWFYRLIQEPRRLWKRYLFSNIKFAIFILKRRFYGGKQ